MRRIGTGILVWSVLMLMAVSTATACHWRCRRVVYQPVAECENCDPEPGDGDAVPAAAPVPGSQPVDQAEPAAAPTGPSASSEAAPAPLAQSKGNAGAIHAWSLYFAMPSMPEEDVEVGG